MRRIIGEVLNLGKRDGWFGLLALLLSLFLYMTVRLTAPPFGPTTGLGRDWPLEGSDHAHSQTSSKFVSWALIPTNHAWAFISAAEFTHRVSPTDSVQLPTPLQGWEMSHELNNIWF
jgi:hypothetical protein